MPIYVYVERLPDGSDGDPFEVLQGLHEDPLTVNPATGLPVRRVLTSAHTPKPWGSQDKKVQLADRNIEKMGFTKYVKGPGGYEKICGDGPDIKRKK